MAYCLQNKELIPDWKGLGFLQLKPFLGHLASQNHIRFIGEHLVHPDSELNTINGGSHDSSELDDSEEPPLNHSTSSGILTHAKAISSPKLNKSSSSSLGNDSGKKVSCPVCQGMISEDAVNRHLDECLNMQMLNNEQAGANKAANTLGAVVNNNKPRSVGAVLSIEQLLANQQNSEEEEEEEATVLAVPLPQHHR